MKKLFKLFASIALIMTGADRAQAMAVGDAVPDIALPSTSGSEVNLNQLKGSWVVLYFYPKSFTPGCTKQACGLRDAQEEMKELGATVLGVSTDKLKTQLEFKEKYKLPFDLLADNEKRLSKAFDVLNMLGLSRRTTFIIDPEGKIAHIIESVSVDTHDQDVATFLKSRIVPE